MSSFVAIDFETADHERDSACAVALVKVRGSNIVDQRYRLIRPPRKRFFFTYIHGISWDDVKGEPDFGEVWGEIATLIDASDLLLAHNAPFDRGVLGRCCTAHGIVPPENQFVCTVKLARTLWNIRPTTLPDVCRHLKISLQHHHAESDALACAQIGLSALRSGHDLSIALSDRRSRRKPETASVTGKKKRSRITRSQSDHADSLEQTTTRQDSEVFGLRDGWREGPHDPETIALLSCAREVNIQNKVQKVRHIEETTVSQIQEMLPGTAEPPSKTQFRSASPEQEIFGYIPEPPLTQHDEKAHSSKRPIADLLKAHTLTLLWSVIMVLGLILALR